MVCVRRAGKSGSSSTPIRRLLLRPNAGSSSGVFRALRRPRLVEKLPRHAVEVARLAQATDVDQIAVIKVHKLAIGDLLAAPCAFGRSRLIHAPGV